MTSSLSNLFNNLSERIHRIKCKYGHYYKNVRLVELNISIATVDLIESKCLCCNKNFRHRFDKKFKARFFHT